MAVTIKIHGNCDVNYMWRKTGSNIISQTDDAYIEALAALGVHSPSWDSNTLMLSAFKSDDLSAGDISQRNQIIKYTIHRQNILEDKRYLTAETSCDETCISDFNVADNAVYRYYITPTYLIDDEEVLGQPIETDTISIDALNLNIVALTPTEEANVFTVDDNEIWNFSLNVSPGSFTPTYNKSIMNTIGRYPKVTHGKTNYLTGKFSVLLGNISCSDTEYVSDDIDSINKWQEFCNNGKLKLLRDGKGHVIPCEITETSYEYSNELFEMPTTVSFSFIQLMDSKDICAYSIGGEAWLS